MIIIRFYSAAWKLWQIWEHDICVIFDGVMFNTSDEVKSENHCLNAPRVKKSPKGGLPWFSIVTSPQLTREVTETQDNGIMTSYAK